MSNGKRDVVWFLAFAAWIAIIVFAYASCAPIDTSPTGPPVGPTAFTNTRADTGEGSTRGGSRETTDSSLAAQSQLTPSPVDALPRITRLVMPMRNMVSGSPMPPIVETVGEVTTNFTGWVGKRDADGYFHGEWFIYENGRPLWRNVADHGVYDYSQSRKL